ncbi:hypothetical protein DDJ69_31290, partial [Klebsiella oxytoca]
FMTRTKFRFKIDFGPLKKIYRFSRNQLSFNIVNFFSRNLDSLLIGRYFSASSLAFYDFTNMNQSCFTISNINKSSKIC